MIKEKISSEVYPIWFNTWQFLRACINILFPVRISCITNSEEINSELEKRKSHSDCYPKLFDEIDTTKFRKDMDIEMCKQIILWSNIGFTNQLLHEIHNDEINVNSATLRKKLDRYFDELKKIFYGVGNEQAI